MPFLVQLMSYSALTINRAVFLFEKIDQKFWVLLRDLRNDTQNIPLSRHFKHSVFFEAPFTRKALQIQEVRRRFTHF